MVRIEIFSRWTMLYLMIRCERLISRCENISWLKMESMNCDGTKLGGVSLGFRIWEPHAGSRT